MLESFKVFDSTDSGTVTATELQHLMTTLETKLPEEEAADLVSTFLSTAPAAGVPEGIDYVKMSQHMVELIVAENKKGKKGKKGGSKKKGKKKK